jgi:hypothetical protein
LIVALLSWAKFSQLGLCGSVVVAGACSSLGTGRPIEGFWADAELAQAATEVATARQLKHVLKICKIDSC